MSRIEDLIAEHCTNGVEYQRVGEIAQVGTGSSDRKDATDTGVFPFYVRSKEVLRSDSFEFNEESIVIPGEGGIGDIFHYASGKYSLHQRAYRIVFTEESIDTKFAYYYFSAKFKHFILRKAVSATVISIRKPMITDFRIPVPPLEVQREIVRILDTFTELEAELDAELEARRQQYEHYRAELLSLPNDPLRQLGDLANNLDSRRRPVTRAARTSGDFPYYGASGVVDLVSDYIFDGDYLLVSEDGANLLARSTPIAFSIAGKTWVNNHAHVLEFSSYVERRFVELYLNSIDLTPYISGATQPKLNKANLNRIEIPDPSLKDKERIVALLDKFDALVNDLSVGLPAELESRGKQYEYYRDKLLTFDEAPA